ncbi:MULTISPECIES: hypothetical protein [Sphaerospermopsis]|uniref:HNH nuclease domain-containing protein n=1 Tax=Sphaerospermopsis aphanizomenoides LEGE 00250 TaxID=2777972 RepID=A0ABR9VEJ2_9CYAN|nr:MULTISPECIES: hypothetical protein [Sphaerospermopsis]MBC5793702.1 hypothetical protein [Sphaerospermopsis sp. LEGE 00249]MBD2135421.1 hypothetical protein [Sphaerospermopsis sp. FACHB-1094]MBD2146597.1 hypothetical protein [Sphaerospermopsis sp. FACHB-1194]MBE9236532.1 hypothetical protein [Sphaerospermopsis aphanizomenoides LEGE 00250]
MIPIKPQPEPDDFDEKVRKKGEEFLSKVPNPEKKDWTNRDYWRRALPDLYKACNHICVYSAEWIPYQTGSPAVDHFIPKSVKPELAYEWDNFRLICSKINSNKGTKEEIIDPFFLPIDSFILDFPSMVIKPNPNLLEPLKKRVIYTIKELKLNEETWRLGRSDKLVDYCKNEYSLDFLKRRYPFIAYELERQGLVEVEKIAYIMGVR